MGDSSTCLMQPFSYVSGIPNDSNEGNPIHALGQSVSFGRFMSESLSWEKWSTFSSHNKYVEEAERYARPGSVAQKKAFFEAHYKSLAARKAAALLEQSNSAAAEEKHDLESGSGGERDEISAPILELGQGEGGNRDSDEKVEGFADGNRILEEDCVKVESLSKNELRIKDLMQIEISKDESSSSEMEKKPLLQNGSNNQEEVNSMCKKKQSDFPTKSSRQSKVPSSPARLFARINPKKETKATPIKPKSSTENVDRRRTTPKSSQKSMNFTPAKDFNKFASSFMSRVSSSSKNYSTPCSENKSARTPLNVPASGAKSVRRKWSLFPTENKSRTSSIFSPFTLKTEERAARRKQKLEEKFNSSQTEKMQQQATLKEKAETEFRKLQQTFCFKARPLPDFYKERKFSTKDQIKQLPVAVTELESPPPVKKPVSSAMKSSNHGKMSSIKKKGQNSVRSFMSRAATMVAHENTSPNIQQSHAFAN